jgi:hypothetical protein
MRTLFTAYTSHLNVVAGEDVAAADELGQAMRTEFPAYYIEHVLCGDHAAAIIVRAFDEKAPIPALLNGWGTDRLTLKLVA